MLEIIKYITSDFWIFMGTVILISVLGDVLNTALVNAYGFICRLIRK